MDWIPHDPLWKWFFGAFAMALLILAGAALGRSIYTVRQYGLSAYLRSVFRIDPENFRIFAVLGFLAVAAMLMYLRGGG